MSFLMIARMDDFAYTYKYFSWPINVLTTSTNGKNNYDRDNGPYKVQA